jgi:hypothetical protein
VSEESSESLDIVDLDRGPDGPDAGTPCPERETADEDVTRK